MPSLLDIAPPELAGKEVTVRGVSLPLRGIPAIEWAHLYARFPELRRIVSGRSDGAEPPARMLLAQAALIAAGTGHPGSEEVERAAMMNLTGEEQRGLVEEIVRLSMPGNVFGPLLDEGPAEAGGGPSTAEPDTR